MSRITQARAFGACTGRAYGSFTRGPAPGVRPVGKLTQAKAFAPHSSRRYGPFTRAVSPEEPPAPPGVITMPRRLVSAQRRKLIERDEILLLIAASIASGMLH